MKLSQIIEARYVSGEPQFRCKLCGVRFTEREMKTRQGILNVKYCPNCGASHHTHARTFTSPVTGNSMTISSDLQEARYYRNRPTADQVSDMYYDVKDSGMVDRWDRIILANPRLYEFEPTVRIMAEVTLKDKQKAMQYVKRFLDSNNLPYTEIFSSEHAAYHNGWEIDIIYKENKINEARYVGANRYFCITWGPATIAYFDFGVTSAIAGSYASPDVTVVVAMSKEKALARAKEFIDSDGLKDWQFKRWYGELNTLSLSDKDVWDFYKPGAQMRRMFETRYAGRKLELSDFQVGDKIIITTRSLSGTENRIAVVRLINHNDLNGITYGPVHNDYFMSSGQGHLLPSDLTGEHRYGIIDVQIFSRRGLAF